MKKLRILSLIASLSFACSSLLHADDETDPLQVSKISPHPQPDDVPDERPRPFSIVSTYDGVAKAKFKKREYKGEHLDFSTGSIEGGGVFYYNADYHEGFNLNLGFTATKIYWEHNYFLTQHKFKTVTVSLGSFTERIDNWLWRAQIAVNADEAGKKFTGAYLNYDLLIWGRYQYTPVIGIHTGFIVQTGMRMDKGWPIFGFDWQISHKWRLSVVYPVDISLNYSFTPHWIIGGGARAFNTRHRIKRDECHSGYLVRYENVGAEFFVKYDNKNAIFNLHLGSTLGGRYRVSNRENRHPHTFKLLGSFYGGAEANVRF